MPQAAKPVERIQQNVLAAAERRLLTWLCPRLPARVIPDHLTMLGFFGAMCISAGYILSGKHAAWLWLSIIGYFINWFGDSLDGSLARFRKTERPKFGYFIDHSADSLGNLGIMIGLGISPYLRLDVTLFGAAAYLLLSIYTFLAARVVNEFRLSYLSGGPTELRIFLIAMSLMMLWIGPGDVSGTRLSPFDFVIGCLGIGLIVLFIIQTFRTARHLYRLER